MNVLAIDTSLGALSVAVARIGEGGDIALAETCQELQTGHAERLMPAVQSAMADAGLGFGDIQRIAVTLGPGTFTGVRTGVAAARAFRLATGAEVVGATSLAVIAHRVLAEHSASIAGKPLLIAIDARRGGYYVQRFGANSLAPETEPREVTAVAAAGLAGNPDICIAGSGARAIAQAAAEAGHRVEVVAEQLEPRAADLAAMAPMLAPLETVSPIYVRPPDAKPQAGNQLARAR